MLYLARSVCFPCKTEACSSENKTRLPKMCILPHHHRCDVPLCQGWRHVGSSREGATVAQLPLHFIYVLLNGEWTVSDHLLIVPPRYQWDCLCRISDRSLQPPALLLALCCGSSEYTLSPLGFLSLDTSVCYSKGSELLFCLSEIVTTWVLTSWLLSSNWELPAVQEILLAWNPTGHSICQSPAESHRALRYRVSLSLGRHRQALISGIRDVSLKGSSANSRWSLHSSSCLVQEIALGTKRHIS